MRRGESIVDWKELKANWMAFDPFDNSVDDVEKTHALESYMWELYVLLHHYDPNVVEMMRKLQMKLLRTRQQFGNLVNITWVSVDVSIVGTRTNSIEC